MKNKKQKINDDVDDIVNENDDVIFDDTDEVIGDESLTQKVKALKAELLQVKKEKTDILTELQKAKADFVNMRKRDENEKKDFVKFAKEGILSDFIPALDSFDMAFSNKDAWEKVPKEWRVGVEYIYNQLVGIFSQNGVEQIDPLGKIFDPQQHDALEMVPVEDKTDDHKIIAVVQKGYEMLGKTIRPAKVKVGKIE